MARKRVKTPIEAINTIEEADAALCEIARLEIDVERRAGEQTLSVQDLKAATKEYCTPKAERIKALALGLKAFHDANPPKAGKTRSLFFGSFGLRKSTKVTVKETTLGKLLEGGRKWMKYITTKHSVNKETLRDAPPDILVEVGAKVESGDEFWYEADREKVVAIDV